MWYRIELNKDNSVASCVQASESRNEGRSVHYIEASSGAEAIAVLKARYERYRKSAYDRNKARFARLSAQGLCHRCARNPAAEGLTRCATCNEVSRARRAAVRAGAPVLRRIARDDDSKLAAEHRRATRAKAKVAVRADNYYVTTRRVYARCLAAFDSMPMNSFRTWLTERLHEAQAKEQESAARRAAQVAAKRRAARSTSESEPEPQKEAA